MYFLVDASLPRAAAALIRQRGDDAEDVRDLGLGAAPDDVIAQYARDRGLTLLTADFDFADIRVYPPSDYSGIVVVDRPEHAKVADVLAIVSQFLTQTTVLANLPGRLAIVDATRVRLRPAVP